MAEKPTYDQLARRVQELEQESLKCAEAEEQSEKAVSILQATLESTADGIVVVNRHGRVVSFNQRFQDLCQIPESIMSAKDDNRVMGHIMDQVKDPETFLQKVADIYDQPDAEDRDMIEFKDGRIFERCSLPQRIGKTYVGRVWSFRDMTANKRAEKDLHESFATLRKALDGIIQAVALTVEKRDPYTAGHQRRVADLARGIATKIGLSENQINGIRIAGSIHDLGKTCVPADILSKPGRLTEHEFGIIKAHPEVGYDILKNIEFPWPIAQTILQHHERLDGSGYPVGLKGKNIIVEARIVAVSDVVEAMSSHRPYRPALGIDMALDEIQKGRGTAYDPDAVDACISLFKTDHFKFRPAS
jgi:HD-GYP domain-containing protein (c-di-GMP phosphodiesterase class II)